jgi:periplasmic divalent cation tolerance protein
VRDSIHQAIVVLVTFPTAEEANRVAAALVDEHLAACVNLVNGVQSVFFWQQGREEASEVLAIIKTTPERLAALSARVISLHSYSIPEIIALPIVAGSEPYLKWVGDSVSNQ